MKYFFITMLTILTIVSKISAQNTDKSRIGLYKWNEVVIMTGYNLTDDIELKVNYRTRLVNSKVGQLFRIIKVMDDSKECVIQILDYTTSISKSEKENLYNKVKGDSADPNALMLKEDIERRLYKDTPDFYKYNFLGEPEKFEKLPAQDVNSRDYKENQAYFKVPLAFIDELAVKETYIAGSFTAGVINFPFKYRPQKGRVDFSGAFNFGAGIGYTFRHKSYSKTTHSIISGYSISNIVLDSSNTVRNQAKLASTNNFTSLSISLGYLIQHQTVQAGIFLGIDQMSKINQDQYGWIYQGQPWISIGFGLAIFSGQSEKKSETTNSNK